MDTGTLNGTKEILAERTVVARNIVATEPMALATATVTTMALEFKFNQRELEALVNLTGNNHISIAVCGLTDPGSNFKEMYLCAVSHKAQASPGSVPETDTEIRPIIGCPYPPEWKDNLALLSHAEVANSPKFFLNALQLKAELPNNAHAASNGDKMVSAILTAAKNETADELETFVTFPMKNQTGTVILGNPLVAKSAI
jgi:hypothetical protein